MAKIIIEIECKRINKRDILLSMLFVIILLFMTGCSFSYDNNISSTNKTIDLEQDKQDRIYYEGCNHACEHFGVTVKRIGLYSPQLLHCYCTNKIETDIELRTLEDLLLENIDEIKRDFEECDSLCNWAGGLRKVKAMKTLNTPSERLACICSNGYGIYE